ncbi:unnamed protein product [Malus baccata var. baccata]
MVTLITPFHSPPSHPELQSPNHSLSLSLSSDFTAAACHSATRRRGLRPKPFLIREFLQLEFRNRLPLAVFGFQSAFARFVAVFSVLLLRPLLCSSAALCCLLPPTTHYLFISLCQKASTSFHWLSTILRSKNSVSLSSSSTLHRVSLLECLFLELPRFYLSPPPQLIASFFTLKPLATFRFDSRINCAQTRHRRRSSRDQPVHLLNQFMTQVFKFWTRREHNSVK